MSDDCKNCARHLSDAVWNFQLREIAEARLRASEADLAFTRVDIITSEGRRQYGWRHQTLSFSVQDDGRTLKVYVKEKGQQ